MECPECGYSDEDASIFARRCKACGTEIAEYRDLPMAQENRAKLNLLRQEVRQIMRRRLLGDGEK